jgi:hypothetical protein
MQEPVRVEPWCRHNFLINHFGRFDTRMESVACQTGIKVAVDWDGDGIESFLEPLKIAAHWTQPELDAFSLGFTETRKHRDRLPEFNGERRPPLLGTREWRKSRKKFLRVRG